MRVDLACRKTLFTSEIKGVVVSLTHFAPPSLVQPSVQEFRAELSVAWGRRRISGRKFSCIRRLKLSGAGRKEKELNETRFNQQYTAYTFLCQYRKSKQE